MNYKIVYTEAYEDICTVHDALYEYNLMHTGLERSAVMAKKCKNSGAYIVRGDDGKIYGGVVWHHLEEDFQTVFVDYMYVDDALRGSGKGKELFAVMEKHVKENGVKTVQVTTNSFQAPGFYTAIGYKQFDAQAAPQPKVPDNVHYYYSKDL